MKSKLWRVVPVAIFVFCSVMFVSKGSTAQAAETKIAVLNMRETMDESNAWKAATKKLEGKYSKDIEKKRKAIKDIEDKISLKGNMMKEDEKKTLHEDYLKKRRDFEQFRDNAAKEEREMANKIINDILAVSRKIGQEEGYSLILEKGTNVIFSVDAMDITKKVIKRHNEEYKK